MHKQLKTLRVISLVAASLLLSGFLISLIRYNTSYMLGSRLSHYTTLVGSILLFLFIIFTTYRCSNLYFLIASICGLVIKLFAFLYHLFFVDFWMLPTSYNSDYGMLFYHMGFRRLPVFLFGDTPIGIPLVLGAYIYMIYILARLIRTALAKRKENYHLS